MFEKETVSSQSLAARDFAVSAHGQQRYGNRPYVAHLTEVVRVLEEFGFADEYLIVGWLHDVVEDTSTTTADIERLFGVRVARLVDAVTGGGDRADHVASIYEKITTHPDGAALKLADRIANVEACEHGDKHSIRYARAHDGFARVIESRVPAPMWQRYLNALSRAAAFSSGI